MLPPVVLQTTSALAPVTAAANCTVPPVATDGLAGVSWILIGLAGSHWVTGLPPVPLVPAVPVDPALPLEPALPARPAPPLEPALPGEPAVPVPAPLPPAPAEFTIDP